ncbi:ABC transporter permease [Treponema vincentii]|uniref:ABC transporter permease n=1 Tax=Treponema vincentii TaxID=69710 RepID=UPI001E5784DE|nr:ABC transporter permease subunit [Treponema vincentii]
MNQRTKRYFHQYWQLYAMLLLPLLYFIIFKYVPIFGNVLAFRRYRPGLGAFGTEWVGLRYFTMFFKDPAFWRAFRNTLTLSLMNLLINFPIPIIFALLLNEIRSVFLKKFVQTVSYMPRFISTVVVIAMAAEILSPSTGILNLLLKNTFDMQPIYFMNEPSYFRVLYIFTDTWQYMGWTAIIYLAAITGINEELYEAAKIDGAGKLQQILYITIPSILPTIMVMLILEIGRLLTLGFEKNPAYVYPEQCGCQRYYRNTCIPHRLSKSKLFVRNGNRIIYRRYRHCSCRLCKRCKQTSHRRKYLLKSTH